jgi:endonuclease YncB( thermonuclease family)
MKTLQTIAILFLFFLLCIPAGAKTIQGRVVNITDGDTIKVVTDGKQIKIRLYGIDTPEKKQAFGQAAKKQISTLLTQNVSIEKKDIDRYGRTVGIVFTSTGTNVNEEMVRSGFAWTYKKYCRSSFCSDWLEMENNARNNKIGLWQQKAVPPWEWRKLQRKK